jgi:hypothetical protein
VGDVLSYAVSVYVVLTVGFKLACVTGIVVPVQAAALPPQISMVVPGLDAKEIRAIGLVPAVQLPVKVSVGGTPELLAVQVGAPGCDWFGLQVRVMVLPWIWGCVRVAQPGMVSITWDCADATPAVPNADASNNAAQPKRVRKRDVMVFSRITS